MTDWAAPWLGADVAEQQRALVDRQLAHWDPTWSATSDVSRYPFNAHGGYPQFEALVAAVRSTQCQGSILEIGCGSGYNREVLDRAGWHYAGYMGVDLNTTAIKIARERYPETTWVNVEAMQFPAPVNADIVVDGSCMLHVEDWRRHLANLCAASRRWVVLHRIPVNGSGTTRTSTSAYGQTFAAWEFGHQEVIAEVRRHGFEETGQHAADGGSRTLVFAKPRHWATYCDRNYLPKLKALHASMKRHCGPFVLHVMCWDEETWRWALDAEHVAAVNILGFLGVAHPEIAARDLPGPPRTRVEHMWTVGPAWINSVMIQTGEPVTYVDADVLFHSSPEPVFAEIGGAPAGIISHGFAEKAQGLPGPTRESHEVFGKYNVGIVHFNDRSVAEDWAERCRAWCYDRVEGDKYGDQKHLENIVKEWNSR